MRHDASPLLPEPPGGRRRCRLTACCIAAALMLPALLTGCSWRRAEPAPPGPAPAAATNPTPAAKTDPEALARQANDLMLRGDNLPAAQLLLRLVGEFPDFVRGWDLLSFACARMENPSAARAAAERAVTIQPDSATARFNAGLAQARMANYPRAIAHLEVAYATNKVQVEPGYFLGKVYEAAGQPDRARAVYRETLSRFPDDADLHRALAALDGDLTRDGHPESITFGGSVLRVTDGTTGAELLKEDLGLAIESARVVDLMGPGPALLVTFAGGSAVYAPGPSGRLAQVGRPGPNPVYNVVNRAIEQTTVMADRSQSIRMQFHYGQFEVVSRWSEPIRALIPPPANPFEAFTELAAGRWAGMATGAIIAEVDRHYPGPSADRLTLLLPEPGGGFRLELIQEGKLVATATATLTNYHIAQLTWR